MGLRKWALKIVRRNPQNALPMLGMGQLLARQ
jgi:hypothetical protein